jgi:hypothetical protein
LRLGYNQNCKFVCYNRGDPIATIVSTKGNTTPFSIWDENSIKHPQFLISIPHKFTGLMWIILLYWNTLTNYNHMCPPTKKRNKTYTIYIFIQFASQISDNWDISSKNNMKAGGRRKRGAVISLEEIAQVLPLEVLGVFVPVAYYHCTGCFP